MFGIYGQNDVTQVKSKDAHINKHQANDEDSYLVKYYTLKDNSKQARGAIGNGHRFKNLKSQPKKVTLLKFMDPNALFISEEVDESKRSGRTRVT